ncbi:MAG: PD-(D/E)XK motif protein, partial [bacterium]
NAVIQDIVRSLRISPGSELDIILNSLARWKNFWSINATGLSKDEALGLFGELWFMSQWLGPVNSTIVDMWQSTTGARHDFQWPIASVEVKTAATSKTCEPIHHIASIDQLDKPEIGELFLFSLQVSDDSLASNSLHALVDKIFRDLQNDYRGLSSFKDKLFFRGYTPIDEINACRTFRIIGTRLYLVDEKFPKIIRRSFSNNEIPKGIVNIEYNIDMSACSQWLVAVSPSDDNAIDLINTCKK